MFHRGKEEPSVVSGVQIYNLDHLNALKSAVAKTAQIDFGLAWNLDTSDKDDEYAFALALASLAEFGVNIVSDDQQVNDYIRRLTEKQTGGKYQEGLSHS